MLLRDILMALPGLTTPTQPAIRTEPLTISNPFQVPQVNIPGMNSLQDFYDAYEIDRQNPDFSKVEIDWTANEPVLPTEPDPEPEPEPVEPTPPVVTPPEPLPPSTQDLSAVAGRVTTVTPENQSEILSLRILTQPGHGNLSVNPDNSLALVLTEDHERVEDISFSYEATYADGRTQVIEANVDVTEGTEPQGWGLGEFYMLEETPSGELVIEHGDNHRKVHITAGDHGLTRADIASAEGLSVDKITTSWLQDHPEYGASDDMALATDIGMELWYSITGRRADPGSHWLLLERGYEYEGLGRVIARGSQGESALHPLYIGAYGDGAAPVVTEEVAMFQDRSSNLVIQGLDVADGLTLHYADNLLLDDLTVSGDFANMRGINGLTFQNSRIIDVVRDEPIRESDVWQASNNRISGAYMSGVEGALLRDNLFDRNGWAEGYDYNMSTDFPMPPSYYNHNLYVQTTNLDITLRENVFLRGASFGVQLRPGGVMDNNSFIDNNAAVNFFSGNNYTLMLDNLVTSAGYKSVSDYEGGRSIGIHNFGTDSSLIGNMVAHLADPANPEEQAEKSANQTGLAHPDTAYFNDTIVYNWATSEEGFETTPNQNIDGLDTAVLDRTTIQEFAADLLGRESATISDLANFLRAEARGALDDVVEADIINAFFREGFGLSTELRGAAETVRFVPDDRADGIRWDNRLNWSTEDLPGTQDGDSVDLGGNRVLSSAQSTVVDDFIFGDNGSLKITGGRLGIDGDISVSDGGNLFQIDNAGQVWVDGYRDADRLEIDIQGGRFANEGDLRGKVALSIGDDGQAILATGGGTYDMRSGSSLSIDGTRARVGFDGDTDEAAVLRMQDGATIAFTASEEGFGRLSEFRSGAMGDGSQVASGVRLDGSLVLDLADWAASGEAGSTVLIDTDQIVGSFKSVRVEGLGTNQDALLRIDYVRDEVTLVMGEDGRGSGMVRMSTNGEEDFIDYSDDASLARLWDALSGPLGQAVDDPLI